MKADVGGAAALGRNGDALEGLSENVAPYFGAATVATDFGLGILLEGASQSFGEEGGQKTGGLFLFRRF